MRYFWLCVVVLCSCVAFTGCRKHLIQTDPMFKQVEVICIRDVTEPFIKDEYKTSELIKVLGKRLIAQGYIVCMEQDSGCLCDAVAEVSVLNFSEELSQARSFWTGGITQAYLSHVHFTFKLIDKGTGTVYLDTRRNARRWQQRRPLTLYLIEHLMRSIPKRQAPVDYENKKDEPAIDPNTVACRAVVQI